MTPDEKEMQATKIALMKTAMVFGGLLAFYVIFRIETIVRLLGFISKVQ